MNGISLRSGVQNLKTIWKLAQDSALYDIEAAINSDSTLPEDYILLKIEVSNLSAVRTASTGIVQSLQGSMSEAARNVK